MSARVLLGISSLIASALGAISATGQVATDGTVGPRLELSGPDYDIAADLGTRAARNLFHSFERFDLRALPDGTIESATFSGPAEIRNVISRVTGGDRSDIDGSIRSTIPGADFFFVNPAGVLFGPNASLDVQGSFHVSTADELRFADGARFSATDSAASSFTVASPEAFGFLGTEARRIEVNDSRLEIPSGETLSILGGEIVVDGGALSAPAGQLRLTALERGEARLTDGALTGARADVTISGGRIEAETQDLTGTVRIEGDRVRIVNQALVSASIDSIVDEAGSITVKASELIVDRAVLSASTGAFDGGGEIRLSSDRIRIANQAAVSVGGGSMTIDALEFTIDNASIRASNGITAGQIRISADRIQILNRAEVSTGAASSGGSILIDGSDLLVDDALISASAAFAIASLGASGISISADRIRIVNRAEVTVLTALDGDQEVPPSITIDTSNLVVDRAAITAGSSGVGRGGGITINANRIELRDGAITSDSRPPSLPGTPDLADPLGALPPPPAPPPGPPCCGDAGDIVVVVRDALIVDGGTISTNAATSGGGGRIALAAGRLLDAQDSTIASNVGGGQETTAGDITIEPRLIVLEGSRIIAQADEGRGGNILITADNLLVSESVISASAGPAGIDGMVVVSAPEVDITGGLVVVEAALLDAASLLRARCDMRRDVGASSFTRAGRGGLAPRPDGPLLSSYAPGAVATAAGQEPTRGFEPSLGSQPVTLALACGS